VYGAAKLLKWLVDGKISQPRGDSSFTIIAIFGKFIFSLSSERVKETACLAADTLSAGLVQYVELETII
jgi:hypothetical protein